MVLSDSSLLASALAAADGPPIPRAALVLAALVIAVKAWHGWKLGVIRQAVSLMALLSSASVVFILNRDFRLPFELPLLGAEGAGRGNSTTIGAGLYLLITMLSKLVFKNTAQQSVGLIRGAFGLAGAVLGAIYGLVLVTAVAFAFLFATGRSDVVERFRAGDFQNALDSIQAAPDKERPHSRRH